MGGNMLGIGNNFQFTSEFNFFGDPEAAKLVLDNFPQHVSSFKNTFTRVFSKNKSDRSFSFDFRKLKDRKNRN